MLKSTFSTESEAKEVEKNKKWKAYKGDEKEAEDRPAVVLMRVKARE